MKKQTKVQDIAAPMLLRETEKLLETCAQTQQILQVHGLLNALQEIEEFSSRISESQFHIVIQEVVLACGFADEVDAWRSVMDHLQSGMCQEASCLYRLHFS